MTAAHHRVAFGEILREIVINDIPTDSRVHLCKRVVQDDICARCGAVIVTKGRYFPPGVPKEGDRPIYLKITPGANAQVRVPVGKGVQTGPSRRVNGGRSRGGD